MGRPRGRGGGPGPWQLTGPLGGLIEMVAVLQGQTVLWAESGRAALEILRGGTPPAVILLDVQMPEMDGVAFQQERLKDPRLADIPVIITAHPRSVDQVRALGVWGYLVKPMDAASLLEAVGRFCAPTAPAAAG